jgi:hypothetical protein
MLPPQAWCRQNFEQVVSNIGKIEWIESDTISCKSMDYAKMLIVTKLLSFIENQFLLQLKDYQYKIGSEKDNYFYIIYNLN